MFDYCFMNIPYLTCIVKGGLVSLVETPGKVISFTCQYMVYLVLYWTNVFLSLFCVGALDDKKLTIIVKRRHTAYDQVPHSLDDE